MAEIKRTGAVSTRAKARAEAKARKEALENEKAEQPVKSKIESEKEAATEKISLPASTAPILKQYADMKKKHPDAIILFRIGDFYECFDTDAQIAADVLGITLTSRAKGKSKKIHLAGFPQHALDTYLPKLVRAGHRVAICEQISKVAKK
ncbi:MAG: hypothetical protein K2L73_02255 [Muribaculaceae bacterium]|nr:hypothetical protein [Muribaculaceae bacterium]